jgi:hypothetical protein
MHFINEISSDTVNMLTNELITHSINTDTLTKVTHVLHGIEKKLISPLINFDIKRVGTSTTKVFHKRHVCLYLALYLFNLTQ